VKLRDLLPEAAIDSRLGAIEATGVTADSRKVKPGVLFVAIAGAKADGADVKSRFAEAPVLHEHSQSCRIAGEKNYAKARENRSAGKLCIQPSTTSRRPGLPRWISSGPLGISAYAAQKM